MLSWEKVDIASLSLFTKVSWRGSENNSNWGYKLHKSTTMEVADHHGI